MNTKDWIIMALASPTENKLMITLSPDILSKFFQCTFILEQGPSFRSKFKSSYVFCFLNAEHKKDCFDFS